MKIAAYNIMSGGFDDYNHQTKVPQRLATLQIAIKKINADVIGLVDTFRWTEMYTAEDISRLFDYPHCYSVALDDARLQSTGHNNGVTLLSRVSLQNAHTIRLGTRNALKAKVEVNETLVSLYLIYLDDQKEATRLMQLNASLETIGTDESAIIMGDFNTLTDVEPNAELVQFYAQNPALAKQLRAITDDMHDSKVIKMLKNAGLIDAGEHVNQPTMPTRLFPGQPASPFLRLDYCFHSPALKINNIIVPDEPIFHRASDHLPLVFEI